MSLIRKYIVWLSCISLIFFMSSCSRSPSNLPNKKEQILRINLRKEPVSLDPRIGNDMVASQVHFMLFEGLLRLNPDLSLSPAQATSYDISPDRKTYTFHLGNRKWSDGTTVTAYDFEKSWKSILDPKFPSPDAYLLYSVKNAALAKQGKASLDEVGIYAKDPKTLVVELTQPSPHFLQVVATTVLLPIPWHAQGNFFVSNGPFCLKEWKVNQEMVFEKNPRYHRAKEVKLKQIIIEIIDRELAVLHMHASGHFDLIGTPLSFFPAILREDLEKRNLLKTYPVATTKFLAFNTQVFPFTNANIRRAFALAIDRKAIVDHITQLNEQEALSIIPSRLLSHAPSPLFTDADITAAQESLKKGLEELHLEAKALSPVTFMYCASEINQSIAQMLQRRWLEVLGVQVHIEQVEFKILHERSEKGNFSIGLFAWLADYADPMNILERFEDPMNHRNYCKWHNETYNALLERATHTTSSVEHCQLLEQAEQLLIKEMPFTCLFHENYNFLIHPYVQGFEVSPLGHIYFDLISIDTSLRE